MSEAARRMPTELAPITHYEIYVYDRRRWVLQVRYRHDQKEEALDEARNIEKTLGIGVKVLRETYRPDTNTCEETVVFLSARTSKPEQVAAPRDQVQTLRPTARRAPAAEKTAAPKPRRPADAGPEGLTGLVFKLLAIIIVALGAAATATEVLSTVIEDAVRNGFSIDPATVPKLTFLTFAVVFLGIALPLTMRFIAGVRKNTGRTRAQRLEGQGAAANPLSTARRAPAPPPPEPMGPWTKAMTDALAGALGALVGRVAGEPAQARPDPKAPPEPTSPAPQDEPESSPLDLSPEPEPEPGTEPGSDPEPEPEPSEETHLSAEIEQAVEKNRFTTMRFLGETLTRVKSSRPHLDNFSRFGMNLLLAGAVDEQATSNRLHPEARLALLRETISLLGLKPAMAAAFCERIDQYMLEPRYMRMFQMGRELMTRFLNGEAQALDQLPTILDDWNKPAEKQPAQRIVAVLFTDMVGSTDLTQARGDLAAQDVVRRHNSIVRLYLAEFDGREIKHTGDGIMASFASTANAVDAAAAIQRAVAEHNAADPSLPLHLRIGINAGEPIQEENDLFGTTVQLAARICAKADSDQILCSNVVRELSAGKDRRFIAKGENALKGFKEPVTLHEVVWWRGAPEHQAEAAPAEAADWPAGQEPPASNGS